VVLPLKTEAEAAVDVAVQILNGQTPPAKEEVFPGTLYTYKDIKQNADKIWGAQAPVTPEATTAPTETPAPAAAPTETPAPAAAPTETPVAAAPTEAPAAAGTPMVVTAGTPLPEVTAAKPYVIGVSLDELFLGREAEMGGVTAEAEKLGVTLKVSNADNDAQTQSAQMQSFINQKVDAILLVAVDENAIRTSTKAAHDAGIPVITFDRVLPNNPDVVFQSGLDSLADGTSCGEYVAAQNDGQPHKILELLGALNDPNAIDRSAGFEAPLKDLTNLTIIKSPTDWNAEQALADVTNAFTANPDIWAIFIPSDFMMSAIETGLKGANRFADAGQPGHVISCAIDGSPPGYDATVASWNDALVVLPLKTEAEAAVDVAVQILNGQTPPTKEEVFPGTLYTYKDIKQNADKIWGAQAELTPTPAPTSAATPGG
jgi:ribose transport system substrate-binding protein